MTSRNLDNVWEEKDTDVLIGELRFQAREQLDPDLSAFLNATANRLAFLNDNYLNRNKNLSNTANELLKSVNVIKKEIGFNVD